MPVSPSARARLFERDDELAALADAVGRAVDGQPGLIAIEGRGGIGKTRLLAEARDRASAAGVQVRSARGSEREQRLPFGVVEQLFASEWAALGPNGPAPAGSEETDSSFATFAALRRLTERLTADGPLMFVVDDLHLGDEPTLRFLGYLMRRLDRLPVTVLATLRPFERAETAPLLGELVADPRARSIRPAPLTTAAISELLAEALGRDADTAFSEACREATGGNPLLLTELAKTLRAESVPPVEDRRASVSELGPRAVLRTVLVRLAGLPAGVGAAPLARAIAVLGDAATLGLAGELAGLTSDEARAAARALIGAEILADVEGLHFVHPLVGSAVYEEIPSPDRSAAHERAASLLHRHGQPAGVVAAHLVLAPPAGERWVHGVLTEAARASLRAGAPGDAVAHLQRALAEPPPPGRRTELVLALARATMLVDGPAAELHLREALALTEDPKVRASVTLELARLLMFLGRVGEGVPLVRDATAALPPEAGDLRRMLATTALMAPLFDLTLTPPPDLVALGRQMPLEPGLGAKMLAAQSSRMWAYDGGSAEACAALALAALEGGELVRADGVFLSVTAVMVLEFADRPEADAGWAALDREYDRHGSHLTRVAVGLFRGYGLVRRGALDEAEASVLGALEAVRDWNGFQGGVHAAAFLSLARRERGDLPGARAALETVSTPDDASDEARMWLDSHIGLLGAEGRFEEVLQAVEVAERRFAYLTHPIDTPPQLHRAVAAHGLGRREEALAAAMAALEEARTWNAPGVLARALRVLAVVEGGAAGVERLTEAVEVAEGTRARLQLAKAQVALGAALRGAGRAIDARPVLRAGFDLAGQLGADALAARARRELHAVGSRPRTTALTGPAALTAAERRVVQRAAAGDSNRAIAETLFVTPKTVELHLSSAYRKLGIAGRRDLAAALAAEEPH